MRCLVLALLPLWPALAADPVAAKPSDLRRPVPFPSSEEIRSSVSATGQLGERELVLLAIANRPELEALRGEVTVATAKKAAAHDLQNPEVRVSYSEDSDGRLLQPYTETESIQTTGSESYTNSSSTYDYADPFSSSSTRESGSGTATRNRTVERRVTPGRTQDVVEERVYENSSSSGSSRKSGLRADGTPIAESERQSGTRRLVSSTRRVINHPATDDQGQAWGGYVRFFLPHPWERRARIHRAAAEIGLAEAQYFAEEDQVVRSVRSAFQQLSILAAELAAQTKRKADNEAYRDWLAEQKTARLGLELAAARTQVYDTLSNVRDLESQLANVRHELASFCGLADASRIHPVVSEARVANPAKLDATYLTDIAMLYRSDVLSTQARLKVAQAQLAEAKAARIPFATFVDAGYSQLETTGRAGQNQEWFVRMGVTLPIWDWTGFNKKRQVFETASAAAETQLQRQQLQIKAEISQALKRLIEAEKQLDLRSKDLQELEAERKQSAGETQLATQDAADMIKGKRIDYDFRDLSHQMQLGRYSALSDYVAAKAALEKALGVRLERALRAGEQVR
jgi:outer membrane protein TolC